MNKLFVLLMLLVAIPALADPSQPTVDSATIADGQTVAITGTSFGDGGTDAPLRWTNFNSGTDGEYIDETGWGTGTSNHYEPCLPRYSDAHPRYSGDLADAQYIERDNFTKQWISTGPMAMTGTKLYTDYYFWFEWADCSPRDQQIKSWELNTDPGYGYPNTPVLMGEDTIQNSGSYSQRIDYRQLGCPKLDWATIHLLTGGFTSGAWTHVQFEIDTGTADTADGYMRMIKDCVAMPDVMSGLPFMCGSDDRMDNLALAGYLGSTIATGNPHTTIYYDEVYISDTWQRVELGDRPVYDNCTHREVQIPATWSDTGITITVNLGSFTDGETAYLFVVDDNGDASAGSTALTVSDDAPPPVTTIKSPTNLRVQ